MILNYEVYQSKSHKKQKKRFRLLIILFILVLLGIIFIVFVLPKELFLDLFNLYSREDKLLQLWNDRQYDAIINLCDAELISNPLNPLYLTFKGFAYYYKAAAELSLENKLPLIDNSIASLRKAKLNDDIQLQAEINYTLGRAYYYKKKYYVDLAIKYLEESLAMGYKGEDTYEYLARSYEELGDYEKEIEFLNMAFEENQSDHYLFFIAKAYKNLNYYAKAERFLLQVIKKANDADLLNSCRFLLAEVYVEGNEYIKAEEQLKEIVKKNPASIEAHYNLALVYQKIGSIVESRYELKQTLRLDPDHYGAKLLYYK